MSKNLDLQLSELFGKEAFAFLKEHKKHFETSKKNAVKFFDAPTGLSYFHKPSTVSNETGTKSFTGERKAVTSKEEAVPADAEDMRVLVAGNTSMFCDTYGDVLLKNAGKKSIKQNKGMIRFLVDHNWTLAGEIGDMVDVRYEDRELRELGWPDDGTAQALMFEADIIKAWNPTAFEKYRTGRVKQHSIGIRYINYLLAVNEPDSEYWEPEYKTWKKYIDDIINKEDVEKRGYFFAVTEFAILENSAVLFGANRLTPTIEAGQKSNIVDQPSDDDIETQPLSETHVDISGIIGEMKLFN